MRLPGHLASPENRDSALAGDPDGMPSALVAMGIYLHLFYLEPGFANFVAELAVGTG